MKPPEGPVGRTDLARSHSPDRPTLHHLTGLAMQWERAAFDHRGGTSMPPPAVSRVRASQSTLLIHKSRAEKGIAALCSQPLLANTRIGSATRQPHCKQIDANAGAPQHAQGGCPAASSVPALCQHHHWGGPSRAAWLEPLDRGWLSQGHREGHQT